MSYRCWKYASNFMVQRSPSLRDMPTTVWTLLVKSMLALGVASGSPPVGYGAGEEA